MSATSKSNKKQDKPKPTPKQSKPAPIKQERYRPKYA